MLSIYDLFFLLLGITFAMMPATYAYYRGNRDGLNGAEERRTRQAKKVKRLRLKLAQQQAKHSQTYQTFRAMGRETISEAKALCEIYRRAAQRRAKSFEPVVPEFYLPQELEAEKPPMPTPLPTRKYTSLEAHA